ncbi:hypothetical protein C2E21_9214 [Chlorella sorokiniana]|uniref:Uncharacterized protein n=1 Tax=Chlorella sorokiniana TaxID=3076 RepID=A0A2P6TC91_CHLSO|nr:hypothetical protein C2E21_9214 [Chlorella sorokiniana]|eukprot:PRW20255.1 hypothetical protein C2E21_9214 [Chlorella sorokiniana]
MEQAPELPPLHAAAVAGDVEEVARLLAEGTPVNSLESRGRSALIEAAICGHEAVIRLLLDKGGNPMLPDANERLPLNYAACRGHMGATRMLLQAAPQSVRFTNAAGHLAAHHATTSRAPNNLAMLELLLDAAPDTLTARTREPDGSTLLHGAAAFANAAACRLLLARAPSLLMQRMDSGQTAFELAIIMGSRSVQMRASWKPWDLGVEAFVDAARALLPAMSAAYVLAVLETPRGAMLASYLWPDLVAHHALTPAQWARVPNPCPGLGRALPAMLRRSEAEAGRLVARLPAADWQRLRTGAASLHRAQKQLDIDLPAPLVRHILSIFDA